MASKHPVVASRGSRKGWVALTTKVPAPLARAVDRAARANGRNRAEHLYRLLLEHYQAGRPGG